MYRELHGAGKPESSLAAFGAAVRRGYAIELDVHLLSDGSVVVFYDDNLKRICGADVEVKTPTARKMRKYRLGDTNERIPLLRDYNGEYALKSFSPLIVRNLRRKFRKNQLAIIQSEHVQWAFWG